MSNILSTHQQHERYCTQARFTSPHTWGRVGDVRRCEHGRIMMAYDVPGVVPPYWRTLHPIWTPVLHWRARRALANDASFDLQDTRSDELS